MRLGLATLNEPQPHQPPTANLVRGNGLIDPEELKELPEHSAGGSHADGGVGDEFGEEEDDLVAEMMGRKFGVESLFSRRGGFIFVVTDVSANRVRAADRGVAFGVVWPVLSSGLCCVAGRLLHSLGVWLRPLVGDALLSTYPD